MANKTPAGTGPAAKKKKPASSSKSVPRKSAGITPAAATSSSAVSLSESASAPSAAVVASSPSGVLPPDMAAIMNQAVAIHQSGNYQVAMPMYRQVLERYPGQVDALHLLGVAHCQNREFESALPLFDQVIHLKPDFAEVYNNQGKAFKSLDRLDEAAAAFVRATELAPKMAEAWTNLGRIKRRQGDINGSIAAYQSALEAGSGDAEAHHFLGVTLKDAGRADEAIAAYRKAIELKPDYAEAMNNLAAALRDRGDLKGAIEVYERAVSVKPDFAAAMTNLGNVLQEAGRLEEAIKLHRRAIELQPELVEAHNNLGALFMGEERADEAVECFEAALKHNPNFAPAWSNLGNIRVSQERIEDARHCYAEALRVKPDFVEALTNLGNLLQDFVSLEEGLASYNRALTINPKFAGARFGRALVTLMMGDLKTGFEEYESRWEGSDQAKKVKPPKFPFPQWKGETPPANGRIIIYYEQGFGDTLQFCRYAPLLLEKFGHVTFVVQNELYRLIQQSMGDRVRVVPGEHAQAVVREPYHYHCPAMSLALAFGTTVQTVPALTPYLFAGEASATRWREYFAKETRPRVGIVWYGSRGFRGDRYRSIPLEAFAPLLEHEDVAWVSLQKVRPDGPASELAARLIDPMEEVRDFADTAALMSELDLVICVDTGVAHLAGALGRPVWMLNRFNSEWRWMRGRKDSPWYPTMRLFNQDKPAIWEPVLKEAARVLPAWLKQLAPRQVSLRPDANPYQPSVQVVDADRYQISGRGPRSDQVRVIAGEVPSVRSAPTMPIAPARDVAKAAAADPFLRSGFAAHQAGRMDEAMASYRQALATDPDNPDALHLLGVIHGSRKEHEQAIKSIRRALAVKPGDPIYLGNLGIALAGASRTAEAADAYRESLAADPNQPSAAYNLGNALAELGRHADAAAAYRQALAIKADYLSAWLNLGNVLRESGAFEEAQAAYKRVLELSPGHAGALLNLGNLRRELGDPQTAQDMLGQVVEKDPFNFRAWNNLGSAQRELGNLDGALASYRRCLEIAPDHAEGHLNYSMALLAAGRYEEGWREYEWRWEGAHEAKRNRRNFPMRQWQGEPLAGRSIILHAEQGLGDALQFARYAPLVARMGARVVLECHPPLKRLFEMLPGIDRVVPQGEGLPITDFHCPLMSLPRAFGTRVETIPARTPYLWAAPTQVSHWARRLAGDPRPRVGLVWAGNPRRNDPGAHLIDRRRSLTLEALEPILSLGGLNFISLQKGESAAMDPRLADWTEDLEDFADTAALVRNLDLVISVDTSVAHLAGGLGVPVWTLSRYDACWRWLADRDDTPWYPTMRLFRQPGYGSWAPVIDHVADELAHWRSSPHL